MPTTANPPAKCRPDEVGAATEEVAAGGKPLVAADPGDRPRVAPRTGALRLARGLRAGQVAATTVEYALMLLLISSLCLAMTAMANSLTGALSRAANYLN